MKKVVIHQAGGWDRLRIEQHSTPTPRRGEVRVDIDAAGVNFADCIVRMGLYSSAKEYVGWPITPGFEFAGRVAAVGDADSSFRVGDEVVGVTRFGAYATEVVVPYQQIRLRPAGLAPHEAAAFPAVHLTAWYALRELANARRGSTILVHSAAGGVGGALVQIGKILGCRVVGIVGASHKVALVEALGADAVVDKSSEDLWPRARELSPSGYDVVLDANGVSTLRQSYKHLAPGGRLVIYGFHTMFSPGRGKPSWLKMASGLARTPLFNPLSMTKLNRSVLAFNLSYLFDKIEIFDQAMAELFGWLERGQLQPPQVKAYPLEDVASAHRALESAQTTGKLVLTTR